MSRPSDPGIAWFSFFHPYLFIMHALSTVLCLIYFHIHGLVYSLLFFRWGSWNSKAIFIGRANAKNPWLMTANPYSSSLAILLLPGRIVPQYPPIVVEWNLKDICRKDTRDGMPRKFGTRWWTCQDVMTETPEVKIMHHREWTVYTMLQVIPVLLHP